MNIIADYSIAEECKNKEVFFCCYKCGKCGRKFADGIMVDDGGTHPRKDEE